MNVTIGITSFERSDCLARLLESINPATRGRPVIVADNSRQAPAELCQQYGVQLISLPFDAGLSACRNAIMQQATTEYVLLCEEDFIFTTYTRIDWLVRAMLQIRPWANVIAGNIDSGDGKPPSAWLHGMYRHNRTLILASGPTGRVYDFETADLTTNFFLIRRETALAHPWPEELKQGEHLAWFWSGKQNGALRITHCPMVCISHNHIGNEFYDTYRQRLPDYRQQWLLSNGFDSIKRVSCA